MRAWLVSVVITAQGVAPAGLAQTGTVDVAVQDYLWSYHVEDSPKKYLEWLVKDPVNLVTKPAYWRGAQWRTVGIELAIVGALLPLDEPVRDLVQDNRSDEIESVVDPIRNLYTGNILELYGLGMFASGLVLRNEKLADSGFLAAESVFYALQMTSVLKALTKRERPKTADDPYEFNGLSGSTRGGGSAFVSGEVMSAYAFAASVSEVWQNPWLTWPLYGLAGAVAVHRLEHDGHWLSDVVGAAFLGHAIGKTVVRFHYRRDATGKVVPYIAPDSVGLQVTFRF